MAKYSKDPFLRPYGNYDLSTELKIKIPDDKILLGFTGYDFEKKEYYGDPVYLPYTGERFIVIITGKNGSGKSVIAANIANQLINRFGHPILCIDPKHEFETHAKPNTKHEKLLAQGGLIPKGIDIIPVIPRSACEDDEETGEYAFNFETQTFNEFQNQADRFGIFMRYCRLDPMLEIPSLNTLQEISGIKLPETTDELIRRIVRKFGDKHEKSKLWKHVVSLKNARYLGKGRKLDPAKLMYGLDKIPKMLIIKMKLGEYDEYLGVTLQILLQQIINDRKRAEKGLGYLSQPPVILMDEADVFCGSVSTSSSRMFERLGTKERQSGIYGIFITQKPEYLSRKLFLESHYVITSKFTDKKQVEAFENFGTSKFDLKNVVANLEWGSPSQHPKQFALADSSENPPVKFYALTCQGMMKEQQKTR